MERHYFECRRGYTVLIWTLDTMNLALPVQQDLDGNEFKCASGNGVAGMFTYEVYLPPFADVDGDG